MPILALAVANGPASGCLAPVDGGVPREFGRASVPLLVPASTPAAKPSPGNTDRTGMAPDDPADPALTHDYTVTKFGVQSTFVWIPFFDAYQLIVPANCGAEHARKPVGYWVAARPAAGAEDVDWARERFGGFYAGKFEAAHADAIPGAPGSGAGATEGGSPWLKVAPRCVPWTRVEWDDALDVCQAYDPHADLIDDEEWTALAVWAMVHGVQIQGNTAYLTDVSDPATTFADDPNVPLDFATADGRDRALTGTGTNSAWTGDRNLTTHTGTIAGVYDLVGNIFEYTASLGLGPGGRWQVRLAEQEVAIPATGSITGLATQRVLRRMGVPGSTAIASGSVFGDQRFLKSQMEQYGFFRSLRGGAWFIRFRAGPWYLFLAPCGGHALLQWYPCADGATGFRPVLRY